MENLDLLVLRTLRDWRRAGRGALLATVTRTWGSSPRPVGSIMALCESGAVVGSVSGGCIEDDLIHRYRDVLTEGPPQRVSYGVSADEAHRFGLPCGGTLELLLEFMPDADALDTLVRRLDQGELVRRDVEVATGRTRLHTQAHAAPLLDDGRAVRNVFGPAYRLLLIGAGQLSEYLAGMALFSGFAVTVCDPREEHRGAWTTPGVTLSNEMPDDVVLSFRCDRRTAIVALTHDPKLDDLALLEALHSESFYVGAIGSRRNQAARQARLIEHFGQTEQTLSRLRGPIGIHIDSKTPAEIAVSVMAELIAVKNGVALPDGVAVGVAKDRQAVPREGPSVCLTES
ncbi:MAG: XdhC family protein [Hydrogenophaga sp.]|nr:XdhC family protein [Hydrogenophaga sp.]MDZ4356762.1 XdhC family protein [Variovorax sp.]